MHSSRLPMRLVFVFALGALALLFAQSNAPHFAFAANFDAAPAAANWVTNGNSVGNKDFIGTTNNKPLVFKTNKVEQMRILPNGNVGIGTNAPGSKLTVAGLVESTSGGFKFPDGTTQLTANTGGANGWGLGGNGGTNPANNFVGTTDNQPLILRTKGFERLRIATDGNIGIGTSATDVRLLIHTSSGYPGWRHTDDVITLGSYIGSSGGGATGGWLGTVSNHDLHFFTNNGQPSQTIKPNGNVGIGTTNPAQSLEVNGVTSMGLAGGIYGYRVGGVGGPYYPTLGFNTYGPLTGASYVAGTAGHGSLFQYQNSDGKLIYYTGTNVASGVARTLTPRLAITSAGKVGIGTFSPSAMLHIRGAADSNPFQVQDVNGNVALNVDPVGHVQIRLAGNNVSGVCYGGGNTLSVCSSAAEYVPSIDGGNGFPETADLVSIALSAKNPYGDEHGPFVVEKSTLPCDSSLLGFIVDPELGADGKKLNAHYLPLAIYGYFPAKVTTANGAIKRGDALTSSSKPGYAMKATGACKIIGYALEDANADGTIQVFAHLSEHSASEVAALRQENQALKQQLAELDARLRALENALPVAYKTMR